MVKRDNYWYPTASLFISKPTNFITPIKTMFLADLINHIPAQFSLSSISIENKLATIPEKNKKGNQFFN
jgi:hypothetical protein